jgi:hypothetical protein
MHECIVCTFKTDEPVAYVYGGVYVLCSTTCARIWTWEMDARERDELIREKLPPQGRQEHSAQEQA